MSKHHKISRRKFLGQASCAAIGTTAFMSSFMNLGLMNTAAAANLPVYQDNDYKALVCILLAGGNDSFNMLVPTTNSAYNEYAVTRSNLALAQNSLLGLNGTTGGQTYGIHPAMPEVQTLYNSGRLGFISNVGTLINPITKTQYENQSANLPLGLFSHADQIQQWQTSIPQSRTAVGWGGRMADILSSMNSNQNISMNISLSGTNVFQAGNNVVEYTINPSGTGSIGLRNDDEADFYSTLRTGAVKSMMENQYQDIFRKTYAGITKNAQDSHQQFSAAITAVNQAPPFTTAFSTSNLSQSLQMVAKTIAARNTLGMSRQTFFITFGGWDHHDEVLNAQNTMLAVVSKALSEFNDAIQQMSLQDQVTTFTISDFGRTLTSNGNGTDHAWGGNVMVMGGSVNGGKIYGQYPSLALNGNLMVDESIIIPTTSCDEYFAELALWFGASTSQLSSILPNIGNFYSPSASLPIGFMTV